MMTISDVPEPGESAMKLYNFFKEVLASLSANPASFTTEWA
jgi:hypothetical protein